MAIARVQSTGKVTGVGSVASVALAFATPPTIGNGIIVFTGRVSAVNRAMTVTDNKGNVYVSARLSQSASGAGCEIFYCAKVTATGAGFVVTPAFTSSLDFLCACAIEVSGVGAGLTVDKVAGSASGTSTTTIATGPTAALASANVFAVAMCALIATQASIAADPGWSEEYEQLSGSSTSSGEADYRNLAGVAGTTPSCNWAITATGGFAAAIVAFADVPDPPRIGYINLALGS